jgi:hypothetical protein
MGLIPLLLLVSHTVCAQLKLYPGGASRPFFAIATIGTRATNCDDCTFLVPLPFAFPFGSRSLTSVVFSSNGNIKLSSDTVANDCCATPLNSVSSASPLVAVQNSDLLPTTAYSVIIQTPQAHSQSFAGYYCYTASCIFSWENTALYSFTGCRINVQAELYASGVIEIRYGSTFGCVGIQRSFAAGIMDNSQGVAVPFSVNCVAANGVCTASSAANALMPNNVGIRFSKSYFSCSHEQPQVLPVPLIGR